MQNVNDNDRKQAIERGEDILQAVGSTRTTVDWQKSAPWWFFLSGFIRLGWRMSHIVFAAIGVWLSYVGLWIVQRFFLGDRLFASFADTPVGFAAGSPIVRFWRDFVNAPWTYSLSGLAGLAVLFAWLIVVWGIAGGVICRRSVVELGARTTIGWGSAFKLVFSRLRAIFEAAGLPVLAVVGICVVPFLLGLLARLGSVGELVAALGVLFTFLLFLPIAWLLLLSVIGFPFMVAAIVTEKDSDAFDGLSRSAAYLFQRPATVILGVFIAGILISLITSLVSLAYVTGGVVYGKTFIAAAGVSDLSDLSTGFARGVYRFAESVVQLLITGLAASMFWSATAAIYLLVRREVDHTEYDELDLQEFGSPLALPSSDYENNPVLKMQKDADPPKSHQSVTVASDSTNVTSSSPADTTTNDGNGSGSTGEASNESQGSA